MTTFTISNDNFNKLRLLEELFSEYETLSLQLASVEKEIRESSVISDDESIADVVDVVKTADDRIATIAAIAGFIS